MTVRHELAALQREYSLKELSEATVAADPLDQFAIWMRDAIDSEIVDANAMTLSTVGADTRPSARVVLLKEFGPDGFVFFTNYESKKGRDLAANPNAVIHIFWPQLERQVEIRGVCAKTSPEESEAYFRLRPERSRLSAWASRQSEIIGSRRELEQRVEEFRLKFADGEIPLPPFWGGFRLVSDRFEFWQGRESRLHDRICYRREAERWSIVRLSP